MDDMKLFVKNEQNINSLIRFTRVFSFNIGVTFVLAKCGRLIVNRGKLKSTSEISLLEGWIDDIDKSYKYLRILQSFGNNDAEVRCKAISEYRKEGGRGLHSIEDVVHQEEQSLKFYVSRKAESDLMMAECKRLIAIWKEPDEAAAWYEKPLHGAWHKGVSEVADMNCTY